jgi:hypothetical protein
MTFRFSLLASVGAAVCLIPCFAQQNATFTAKNTPTSAPAPGNTYTVDVNNDGIPDVITDRLTLPNAFEVFIANGDGTFHAGYTYTFPMQYQGSVPMTWGDFNGDGKLDLVFELAGSNQIAVFLGNGDGTFQSPMYETIALPTGEHFGGLPIVTADYTGDGKLDLVTESNADTVSQMILIPGDGTGHFGAAKTFYTAPANRGAAQIAIGDFDGDGRADVAFLETYDCSPGNCSSIVHVDYGDGAGNFTDTTSYSSGSVFMFRAGDLNDDSRTDLFGFSMSSSPQLITLYGQADRTMALYSQTAGSTAGNMSPQGAAMADFNGDGRMDIAGISSDGTNSELDLYLNTGSPGAFTHESIPIQGSGIPLVGDFNRDTKPDVVYVNGTDTSNSSPENIVVELNSTASGSWGNCAYVAKGQGINVCAPPASTTSPVQFLATANSYGQIRKIEVWVDGKKIGEQWHTWGQRAYFGMSGAFSVGTHNATVYEADVDNRLQQSSFTFTVGSGGGACAAPSSAGVHVCSPSNGSTVSSPVTASAAATVTGTIARMEVWVDGVKRYSDYSSTSLNTSIILPAGNHRFDYYAVNTAGQKWESTVYATVSGGSGGCAAPSSAGVHVCSPVNGSTVHSPVQASAAATVTGTIARMEVWVDGVKKYSDYSTTTLNTSISLATGMHRFDYYAVNTAGQKWETTVYATVQ